MDRILEAVVAAVTTFCVLMFAVLVFALCKGLTKQTAPPDVALSSVSVGEESVYFDPALSRISMAELQMGTKNFSPELIIGDGSFGLVYKAQLYNWDTVAVKKLGADAFQGLREFKAEMETLGKIKHQNIVTILGFCSTGSDRILIYEYIEKGSLDQWLLDTSSFSPNSSNVFPLPWATRLNIIKGVANGLAYMHNLAKPIIHRDIKASNILLDSEFEAHIADFGLARRIEGADSHVSTQVAGTMGYLPPEYILGGMATVMGDVYSFGILMLEIATARRPNLPFRVEGEENAMGLGYWARKMVSENRYMEMLDTNIPREEAREESVLEFFKIAILCTDEMGKFRPTMNEVLGLLRRTHI